MVVRTIVTAVAVVLKMCVKRGASGVGKLPLSLLKVTAVNANARPSIVLPVCIVIDTLAMMVPLNLADVPIVAEEPTCQKTFLACAPPVKITWTSVPTVSVEPIWKIQTSSTPPVRVRSPPVIDASLVNL